MYSVRIKINRGTGQDNFWSVSFHKLLVSRVNQKYDQSIHSRILFLNFEPIHTLGQVLGGDLRPLAGQLITDSINNYSDWCFAVFSHRFWCILLQSELR